MQTKKLGKSLVRIPARTVIAPLRMRPNFALRRQCTQATVGNWIGKGSVKDYIEVRFPLFLLVCGYWRREERFCELFSIHFATSHTQVQIKLTTREQRTLNASNTFCISVTVEEGASRRDTSNHDLRKGLQALYEQGERLYSACARPHYGTSRCMEEVVWRTLGRREREQVNGESSSR